MAEALELENPVEALMELSRASQGRAQKMSLQLLAELEEIMEDMNLPELLTDLPNQKTKTREENDSNAVQIAMACADSIETSLTKIASGGTQASQEIRSLEQEKSDCENHALDVETACQLRHMSEQASEALTNQRYDIAAQTMRDYNEQKRLSKHTERALGYAGEYTMQHMETTQEVLRRTILEKYTVAVEDHNLKFLGELTPLLQMVQLEKEGVALYLRYLQAAMTKEWNEAPKGVPSMQQMPGAEPQSRASLAREEAKRAAEEPPPPYVQMARIYNCAVQTLRHHLPMVSYCLCQADGDAAVVQLVHVQVEHNVIPIFQTYVSDRQLRNVAQNANRIYALMERKFTGGGVSSDHATSSLLLVPEETDETNHSINNNNNANLDMDDCGFAVDVGSLADVDGAMEEAALCLQHTESYVRFLRHTVSEVNKAREHRFQTEAEEKRLARERLEWATGIKNSEQDNLEETYRPVEIIPAHTQLHEVVAEVGGYYSGIERSLLLASMQRAFVQASTSSSDPRLYTDFGIHGNNNNNNRTTNSTVGGDRPGKYAKKSNLVETCLYATRRATQRAFATGHTGTASATANFASDCLGGVLLDVMSHRAQEYGVARLKPGEGLLEGSSGLFGNAGNAVLASANMIRRGASGASGTNIANAEEFEANRRRIEQSISHACATMNDLEVAVTHTEQLEKMLLYETEKGYPTTSPPTEQLIVCVKTLTSVAESFRLASNRAIESLVSVLTSRVRSIVSNSVGADSGTSTTSFSVIGTVKGGTDRATVRMNYNLDDATYQQLQLSEGYMSRLCVTLDEIVRPLRLYLAPRLSDAAVLGILGSVAKRVETALRRCQFTALGALSLDSDIRDLLLYAKDRLDSPDLNTNAVLYRACIPLARLVQITRLLQVDDLEDVVDLISSSKRKGTWDLKLEEAKAFLSLRVEFESRKVNELLSISEEE